MKAIFANNKIRTPFESIALVGIKTVGGNPLTVRREWPTADGNPLKMRREWPTADGNPLKVRREWPTADRCHQAVPKYSTLIN